MYCNTILIKCNIDHDDNDDMVVDDDVVVDDIDFVECYQLLYSVIVAATAI